MTTKSNVFMLKHKARGVAVGLVLASIPLMLLFGYSAVANDQINTLKRELSGRTLVPVVLPSEPPARFIDASVADPSIYSVAFNRVADCSQVEYGCTVSAMTGLFSANSYPIESGGVPVELENGIEAYFFASDDPDAMAFLLWDVDRYRYELSLYDMSDDAQEKLVEIANSAY